MAGPGVFCAAGAWVGASGAGVVAKAGGEWPGTAVCGPAQPDRKDVPQAPVSATAMRRKAATVA